MTQTPQTEATPEERRALSADELGLSDQARHPTLRDLSDAELGTLVSRLRDRRNRARDLADRQSREARAKADPSGLQPARSDAGMRGKHDYLSDALERAIAERDRRGGEPAGAGDSQADLARKAMTLKEDGAKGQSEMAENGSPLHPDDPDASAGKAELARTERRIAPSGALDHAGDLPSRERSRTRY